MLQQKNRLRIKQTALKSLRGPSGRSLGVFVARVILLSSFHLLALISLEASADPIIIEHAEKAFLSGLSSKDSTLILEGSTRLCYKGIKLEAERVKIDIGKGFINAWDVILKRQEDVVFAKSLSYDLNKEMVLIHDAHGRIHHLYIEGKDIEIEEEKKIVIKEGSFTTCEYKHPHYKIMAGYIVIYPKRYLLAYNVIPYIKDLPFFYLPFYYRCLKHGPHLFVVPGYSSRSGLYLKSKYRIYLGDDHLDLILDYYKRYGFAEGLNYQYRLKRDNNGSLSLYHIREEDYDRWKASFFHYQIFKDLLIQGRVDYQSDESIDYDYNRVSLPRIEELDSYLCLSEKKRDYILRVLFSRRDRWDGKNFIKDLEELPKLTLWQRPLPFGPFFYQIKGESINEYRLLDDGYSLFIDIEGRLFFRLNIGPPFTIVQEIGLRERERMSLVNCLTLKIMPLIPFKGNLTYRFEKMLDEGLEFKDIHARLDLTFPRWCRVLTNTTYDLTNKEYGPLIGSAILSLPYNFKLELTTRFDIEGLLTKGLDLSIKSDGRRWDYGLLAYYARVDDKIDIFDLGGRFSLWLSPKTKLNLRGLYEINNKELREWDAFLYQDLHCLELEFGVRRRPIFMPIAGSDIEWWTTLNLKRF